MLLSDESVIRFLSKEVVPCWESLRPVPVVTIDAGDGRVLRRTLGGNTAFFLCTAEGEVVDVYPGISVPTDFLSLVSEGLAMLRTRGENPLLLWMRTFHSEALRGHALANDSVRVSASKSVVESPLLRSIHARATDPAPAHGHSLIPGIVDQSKQPLSPSEILHSLGLQGASHPGKLAVELDSRQNRTALRALVHASFAQQSRLMTPLELRDVVFRDLLHLDLNDPWLGLLIHDVPGTPG